MVEPTRGTRMLPYAETLIPRTVELTDGCIPAPFHFSNFEKSVLDKSGAVGSPELYLPFGTRLA